MNTMRRILLQLGTFIDPLYFKCTRLEYLADQTNIFRIRLNRYKGREVILSDGTNIKKNDLLVKIHFHNVRLLTELKDISSEIKKVKRLIKEVQSSLPGVEEYIRQHKNSDEIKGIIGITSLCSASQRLGFDAIAIHHPVYRWLKWSTSLPIMMVSKKHFSILKQPAPSYLFMSKNKLRQLYGIQ
jgi:hypothetical protein